MLPCRSAEVERSRDKLEKANAELDALTVSHGKQARLHIARARTGETQSEVMTKVLYSTRILRKDLMHLNACIILLFSRFMNDGTQSRIPAAGSCGPT